MDWSSWNAVTPKRSKRAVNSRKAERRSTEKNSANSNTAAVTPDEMTPDEADALVVKTTLQMNYVELQLCIDELVWSYVAGDDPVTWGYEQTPLCARVDFHTNYRKYRQLERLFHTGILARWERFHWKRALKLGWLSRSEEDWFKEEIAADEEE